MDPLPQELGEVLEKGQLLLVAAMIFANDRPSEGLRERHFATAAFDEAAVFLAEAKSRGADLMSIAQTMNEESAN